MVYNIGLYFEEEKGFWHSFLAEQIAVFDCNYSIRWVDRKSKNSLAQVDKVAQVL